MPDNVTRVIVVGNFGKPQNFANEAALNIAAMTAVEQQKMDNLILKGEAIPTKATTNDEHLNLYEATVAVAPQVARFEIEGVACNFIPADGRTVENGDGMTTTVYNSYSSLKIEQIAINNYYGGFTLGKAGSNPSNETLTSTNVSKFFENLTSAEGWTNDVVGVTLTADNAVASAASTDAEDNAQVLAYNVFPTLLPQFVIRLTGVNKNGTPDDTLMTMRKAFS